MKKEENRLVELEIKAAYHEDLVQELNKIVAEQQQRITMLESAFRILYDRVNRLDADKGQDIVDEPPPHY